MAELLIKDQPPGLVPTPFPHAHVAGFVDRTFAHRIGELLQKEAAWEVGDGGFYRQWQNRQPVLATPGLASLISPAFIEELRQFLASLFACPLGPEVELNMSRLTPGQKLGVHTDEPRLGADTHRAILYVGPKKTCFAGGEFLALAARDLEAVVRRYRPQIGSLLTFEASNRSFHAVTAVESGERFSIQFYFWHEGNRPCVAEAIEAALHAALQHAAGDEDFVAKAAALEHAAEDECMSWIERAIEAAALLRYWQAPRSLWSHLLLPVTLADGDNAVSPEDAPIMRFARGVANRRHQVFDVQDWRLEQQSFAGKRFGLPAADALRERLYDIGFGRSPLEGQLA